MSSIHDDRAVHDALAAEYPRMEQTRITLKKLIILLSLSEETTAFSADVYFDGKKVGHASNHGIGGRTDIRSSDHPLFAEAEAYAKTVAVLGWAIEPFESVLEQIVADEVEKNEVAKANARVKRLCLKEAMFRAVGDDKNDIRTITFPKGQPYYSVRIREHILAKYPGATILNETIAGQSAKP